MGRRETEEKDRGKEGPAAEKKDKGEGAFLHSCLSIKPLPLFLLPSSGLASLFPSVGFLSLSFRIFSLRCHEKHKFENAKNAKSMSLPGIPIPGLDRI